MVSNISAHTAASTQPPKHERKVNYLTRKPHTCAELENFYTQTAITEVTVQKLAKLDIIVLLDVHSKNATITKAKHNTLVLTLGNRLYLYPKSVKDTMADLAETSDHETLQLRRLFTSMIAMETLQLLHTPLIARRCTVQHLFIAMANDRRRCRVWFNLLHATHIHIIETQHGRNQVRIRFSNHRKAAEFSGDLTARISDFRQTLNLLKLSEYAWTATNLAKGLITPVDFHISQATLKPSHRNALALFAPNSAAYALINGAILPGELFKAGVFLERAQAAFRTHVAMLQDYDHYRRSSAKHTRVTKYERGKFASPEQVGEDFAEQFDF